MTFLRRLVLSTVLGAAFGLAAGAAISWPAVGGSFQRWSGVWRDCGPHVFVALEMGAAIGFSAALLPGVAGSVLTLAAGAASGYLAPVLYARAFGEAMPPGTGFFAVPMVFQALLAFCGGSLALLWRFGVARMLD
jgi:hypothetical protein